MTRDEENALAYIHRRTEEIMLSTPTLFPIAGDGRSIVCPVAGCNNGRGKDGTGLALYAPNGSNDRYRLSCKKLGDFDGDLIDYVVEATGCSFAEGLKTVCDAIGYRLDDSSVAAPATARTKTKQKGNENSVKDSKKETSAPEKNYEKFYQEAHRHIHDTEYPFQRGFSAEILDRYNIGFVRNCRRPELYRMQGTDVLIIPYNKSEYNSRLAVPPDRDDRKKYIVSKGSHRQIYPMEQLKTPTQPVHVVEGELDALSIIQAGGASVSLGGANNTAKLFDVIDGMPQEQRENLCFLIALDSDEAGDTGAETIKGGLDARNISWIDDPIMDDIHAHGGKDANDLLRLDEKLLRDAVSAADRVGAALLAAEQEKRKAEAEKKLQEERQEVESESAFYLMDRFQDIIEKSPDFAPTGFSHLDKLLDGGMLPGLYVIGAISSLGKTTFCMQVADNIASSGRDVLIFSLEMSRVELIAKSISRLTYLSDMRTYGKRIHARSTREILAGYHYKDYSQETIEAIVQAEIEYSETIAKHVFITEGMGNVTVDNIREKVSRHARVMGRSPVVVVDYLQILAPTDPRATDKQNTDKAVLELKRISRDFDVPVIVVSSFNRDNYADSANMAAFKESGAIEYSADVLIGLQYAKMDCCDNDSDAEKKREFRKIIKEGEDQAKKGYPLQVQAKILKNRNGVKGSSFMGFMSRFNYYYEVKQPEE